MTYRLLISGSVYEELNETTIYYEDQQANLGLKFLEGWERTIEHLSKSPLIYQKKFKQFRYIQFEQFPFLIIYEVEKRQVVIYKLIHAKRHPAIRFVK